MDQPALRTMASRHLLRPTPSSAATPVAPISNPADGEQRQRRPVTTYGTWPRPRAHRSLEIKKGVRRPARQNAPSVADPATGEDDRRTRITADWGIHLTGVAQLRGLVWEGPIWP